MRWLSLALCVVACAAPSPTALAPAPPPRPPEAVAAKKPLTADPTCAVVLDDWQATIKNVSFQYNSAKLADDGKTCCALVAVAALLQDNPSYNRAAVEVHTDERGNNELNALLTQKQAEAIVAVLVDLGIDRSRLVPIGEGEECPVDLHHDEDAWAKNRRVVLTILKRDGKSHGMTPSCKAAYSKTPKTIAPTTLHCLRRPAHPRSAVSP